MFARQRHNEVLARMAYAVSLSAVKISPWNAGGDPSEIPALAAWHK